MTTADGAQTPTPAGELPIDAVVAPKLSFATHRNGVPVLRELRLVDIGEAPVEQVVPTAEADPPVFAPRTWQFDRIAGGGELRVTQRDLPLDAGLLPQDASGIDVPRVWTIVRRALRDVAGFEVVPDVMLGAFSSARCLMGRPTS